MKIKLLMYSIYNTELNVCWSTLTFIIFMKIMVLNYLGHVVKRKIIKGVLWELYEKTRFKDDYA